MVPKPGWSLILLSARASAMKCPPGGVADIDIERDQNGRHQDQRLGAAQRPIAARTELLADETADHQMRAATEDQRRQKTPERGDKQKQAAGNISGFRRGDDPPPQDLALSG